MSVEMGSTMAEHHLSPPLRPATDADIKSGTSRSNFREIVVDLMAGCVSGCAGVVVGQPFDTVKVRLQTQEIVRPLRASLPEPMVYSGAMQCAAHIVRNEGLSALFKGMSTPLASTAFLNAIVFGMYEQSRRMMTAYGIGPEAELRDCHGEVGERVASSGRERGVWSGKSGEMLRSFFGGSFAGLCQTTILIPSDIIKIKLQVQVGAQGSDSLLYKGPIDCGVKIVREHGVSGLFRGAPATIFRESPGCGIYFASYEVTKQWLEQRWGLGEQASSFGAGGFAGGISWLLVYPFDVVKSVQQASTDPLDASTRSMAACCQSLYRSAGGGIPGVRRFFRGVSTTVARAVPVNAVIFPTFELMVRLLN